MTIHKEGFKSIFVCVLICLVINSIAYWLLWDKNIFLFWIVCIISFALLFFIISFFRIPNRDLTIDENAIISPADGKIVVIEEVFDTEYFKEKKIQISVFMSPLNVHVNRNPIRGTIVYNQYHKGKYLVAWHPKSSTENERWSTVAKHPKGEILYKQIAGALAKRICNYLVVGQKVDQSAAYGFIKFGSRVDILLPLDTKIKVELNQNVQGGVTSIAEWK